MRQYLFLATLSFILFFLPSSILAESFEEFYNSFKLSEEFRIHRTKFPLRMTIFTGEDEHTKKKVHLVEKAEIVTGRIKIYPNYKFIAELKYVEILEKLNAKEYELSIGPPSSDVAVSYKFTKLKNLWYLIEYTDYWGV